MPLIRDLEIHVYLLAEIPAPHPKLGTDLRSFDQQLMIRRKFPTGTYTCGLTRNDLPMAKFLRSSRVEDFRALETVEPKDGWRLGAKTAQNFARISAMVQRLKDGNHLSLTHWTKIVELSTAYETETRTRKRQHLLEKLLHISQEHVPKSNSKGLRFLCKSWEREIKPLLFNQIFLSLNRADLVIARKVLDKYAAYIKALVISSAFAQQSNTFIDGRSSILSYIEIANTTWFSEVEKDCHINAYNKLFAQQRSYLKRNAQHFFIQSALRDATKIKEIVVTDAPCRHLYDSHQTHQNILTRTFRIPTPPSHERIVPDPNGYISRPNDPYVRYCQYEQSIVHSTGEVSCQLLRSSAGPGA